MHVSGTVFFFLQGKRPREKKFLELDLSQIALNPVTSEFNMFLN